MTCYTRKFTVCVFVISEGSPILQYRRLAGTWDVIHHKTKFIKSDLVITSFDCTCNKLNITLCVCATVCVDVVTLFNIAYLYKVILQAPA